MQRLPLTAFFLLLYLTFHLILHNQCVVPEESAVLLWHGKCITFYTITIREVTAISFATNLKKG
jgi:hypothetical protein